MFAHTCALAATIHENSYRDCLASTERPQIIVGMSAPTSGVIWGRGERSGPRSLGTRAAPILRLLPCPTSSTFRDRPRAASLACFRYSSATDISADPPLPLTAKHTYKFAGLYSGPDKYDHCNGEGGNCHAGKPFRRRCVCACSSRRICTSRLFSCCEATRKPTKALAVGNLLCV